MNTVGMVFALFVVTGGPVSSARELTQVTTLGQYESSEHCQRVATELLQIQVKLSAYPTPVIHAYRCIPVPKSTKF